MDRLSENGNGNGRDAEFARLARLAIETQTAPAEGHIVDDEELLACWSAGLLTARARQQMEHHLSVCGDCRQELMEMIECGAVTPPQVPSALRTMLKAGAAVIIAIATISLLVFISTQLISLPGRPQNRLKRVDHLLAQGNPREAFDLAKDVFGQTPDSEARFGARRSLERAGYELARNLLRQGDFAEVGKVSQDVAKHAAGSARLANLRLQAERRQRAEIGLTQANMLADYGYELDGSSPAKALPIPDEATEKLRGEYQRAVAEYPADAVLRLNYGQFLLAMNDAEAAEEQFIAALKCGGHEATAQLGLGLAAFVREDFEAALRHFSVVLKSDSRSIAAHLNMAACLKQLGRTAEADRHWRDAARLTQDADLRQQILAQIQVQNQNQLPHPTPIQGPARIHGTALEAPPRLVLRNERAPFMVRVSVDRDDRAYQIGDTITASVISARAGYLYLLYYSADGRIACLFPNQFQQENRIPAGQPLTVPAAAAPFRIRVSPPGGREWIKAVVTSEPLDPGKFGVESLTNQTVTPLSAEGLRGVYLELKGPSFAWAEHEVALTIRDGSAAPAPATHRRWALVIGINEYVDRRIRRLTTSVNDAREVQRVLQRYCGVNETTILTDSQATSSAIRDAIDGLVQTTQPGDTVFIYWSGHGGRCADNDGDEVDGLDEYLVPYDGQLDDVATQRQTMLLDDTFGRWIQDFDGRQVVLLLDACHAGGASVMERSVAADDGAAVGEFDFLDAELVRVRDVGQRDAVMLASAKSADLAFQRREGDLSVMTYFLANFLARGEGPITLQQAYEQLRVEVPAYVEQKHPGSRQTPILVGDQADRIVLRP